MNLRPVIMCLYVFVAACHPTKPADIKLSNCERAKLLQDESDRLAHEALCLRVASGDLAAMAEMKMRDAVCDFN